MTRTVTIELSQSQYDQLRRHLFAGTVEQVAFGIADWRNEKEELVFEIRELRPIPRSGFLEQSAFHIELDPRVHADLIKVAFDARAALVEFHSHRSRSRACFSWSDLTGFSEFVPHILWRLPDRPYGAVVLHEASLDGLVWIKRDEPLRLHALRVGDRLHRASAHTRLTPPDSHELRAL